MNIEKGYKMYEDIIGIIRKEKLSLQIDTINSQNI